MKAALTVFLNSLESVKTFRTICLFTVPKYFSHDNGFHPFATDFGFCLAFSFAQESFRV